MKLSSLTTTDKIKLAAELDGFTHLVEIAGRNYNVMPEQYPATVLPDYATSYDAIIPCLTRQRLWNKVMQRFQFAAPTPAMILDELLIETGKCER